MCPSPLGIEPKPSGATYINVKTFFFDVGNQPSKKVRNAYCLADPAIRGDGRHHRFKINGADASACAGEHPRCQG